MLSIKKKIIGLIIILFLLALVLGRDNEQSSNASLVTSLRGDDPLVRSILPMQHDIIAPIGKMKLKDQPSEYLELKKHSSHYHYENGSIQFSSKAGEQNTWNGTHYNYYIWNETEKSIQYANSKMYFYEWYAKVDMNNLTIVDDCRWNVEYWREQGGGEWRTLDLYNHYWYDPIIKTKSVEFIQGYNDTVNFLNVSYLVMNSAQVKLSLNFISGEERDIRFVWALTGMDGEIDYDQTSRVFSFADIIFSCNDTESNMTFSYNWEVANKKLDVAIGNFTVGVGTEVYIDPTFSEKQETDAYDLLNYKKASGYHTLIDSTSMAAGFFNAGADDYDYHAYIAYDTDITSSIASTSNAELSFYCYAESLDFGDNEALSIHLYDKGDEDEIWNETEAFADNQTCWEQSTYYYDADILEITATGNFTVSDANGAGDLVDQWVTHHNSDPSGRQFFPMSLRNGTNCDEGTDDRAWFRESTYGTASQRPTLTFTYTLGGAGNNAPVAVVDTAVSSNLYAGISFTAKTNVTDADGAADLDRAYLGLGDDQYDITFNSSVGVGSLSVSTDNGSAYVTSIAASGSSITNGYQITWTVILDWDWSDFDDSLTVDTWGRCKDDEPEFSTWNQHNTNADYENDLECVLLNIEIDPEAESGGDSYINDTDWFRGGVQVNVSGVVEYSGSSQTFNDSYGSGTNVTLYYDGATTGQGDTQILNGAFNNILYTPTSASGLDTTAYFDVQVLNIQSNGADETASGIEVTSKRDNEIPTVTLSLDPDSNTGTGYDPNTGYYDDDSIDFTASGASDGSGSGLPSNCYSWNQSAWESASTKQYTSQPDDNITVYLDLRDNVGNNATTQEAWVVIDTDSPASFTLTFERHTGIVDGYYAYLSGSTIYFNSAETDFFNVTVNNDGQIGNSAFWFCVLDNNSVFETSYEDSSGLPLLNESFNYNGDSSGSFIIRIVNNAGNYQTFTYTATEDVTAPTGSFTTDSDSASIGFSPNDNYDDDSTIDFTSSGWIDGSSGLPSDCYSYNQSAWTSSTTKQYTGQSDGNITVTVYVRDNVGNNGTASDWVIVDTVTPSGFTLTWERVNGSWPCVKNSTGFYFDDSQNNYTTVHVNDTGTIGSSFWFLVWDNNSVMETSEEDSSGLNDTKNFTYWNDDNGTFVILVVNNAGNYQNISVSAYDNYDSGEPPDTTTTTTAATAKGTGDATGIIFNPIVAGNPLYVFFIGQAFQWLIAGIMILCVFLYMFKRFLGSG